MSDLVERFRAIADGISTHGLELNWDLYTEVNRSGEIDTWLYVWDLRGREITSAVTYSTVDAALESLEAEYRLAVDTLVSQECGDVYGAITGITGHPVDVNDHPAPVSWNEIVADEIAYNTHGDDLWTFVDAANVGGYWLVAAELETILRKSAQ